MTSSNNDSAKVTLIPGDGIGPEVARATLELLKAAGAKIDWEEFEATLSSDARGEPRSIRWSLDPQRTASAQGPTPTPVGVGHRSINVALRKALDFSANLRPVKNYRASARRFRTSTW